MTAYFSNTRRASRCRVTMTLLLACCAGQGGMVLGEANTKAAKELSDAFSAAATAAMPAVVLIRIEKSVEVPAAAFNDPFGQFNDDMLRRFFGNQWPPAQRAPQKQL